MSISLCCALPICLIAASVVGWSQANIAGAWKVAVRSAHNGPSFSAIATVTQSGVSISGTLNDEGNNPCAKEQVEAFSGAVQPMVSFDVESTYDILELSGGDLLWESDHRRHIYFEVRQSRRQV